MEKSKGENEMTTNRIWIWQKTAIMVLLVFLIVQPAFATRSMLQDCNVVNMSTVNRTAYLYDCQVPEIPVVMNASCSMTGYSEILSEYIEVKSNLAVCKNDLNLTKMEISKVSGILSTSESIAPALAGLYGFLENYTTCSKSMSECERMRDKTQEVSDKCNKDYSFAGNQLMLLTANLTTLSSLKSVNEYTINRLEAEKKKASDGQMLFGVGGAALVYYWFNQKKKKELGAKGVDKNPFAGINLAGK